MATVAMEAAAVAAALAAAALHLFYFPSQISTDNQRNYYFFPNVSSRVIINIINYCRSCCEHSKQQQQLNNFIILLI